MLELAACAPATTSVACLTNGLEAERIAARWFADVHAVCVMTPAEYLEPGLVRQWAAPVRGILDLGRYPAGRDVVDDQLAAAFTSAGYASEPRADVLRWKRTKLLANLANALEALCGRASRDSELVARARAEAVAVFAAAGLERASDDEDRARRVVLRVQPIGDETRPGGSTWQSLARGRSLETDYLNGEIALLGRLHGVATPVNAGLQRLAAAAARAGRAPGSMTIDQIAAAL
jgi:2-dehydropantoate 2-reductase